MSRRKSITETVTKPATMPLKAEPVVEQSPLAQRTATDLMLDSMRMTSVKKAAETLGVTVTTIWNWINSGELRSAKVGGRRLIPVAEVSRIHESRSA